MQETKSCFVSSRPAYTVRVTCFEQRFAEGEVLNFDNPVGSRVVWGDANVVDMVPFSNVLKRGYDRSAVVGDNLHNGAPSADNLFEDEISQGLPGLSA
jgi:hypothetical protein